MTRLPRATAARHPSFKLERWHRRGIYAVGLLLFLSGVAWLVLHYFMRPTSEFGESVHPLEPWAMKFHGAAAMGTLFFVGSLLHMHIRRAIRAGRNAVTGWTMIATLAFLTLTGYGLYYLAGESDRPIWSLLHWSVGVSLGMLFVVHVIVGRRSVRH